jgi:hypothetical protein
MIANGQINLLSVGALETNSQQVAAKRNESPVAQDDLVVLCAKAEKEESERKRNTSGCDKASVAVSVEQRSCKDGRKEGEEVLCPVH